MSGVIHWMVARNFRILQMLIFESCVNSSLCFWACYVTFKTLGFRDEGVILGRLKIFKYAKLKTLNPIEIQLT